MPVIKKICLPLLLVLSVFTAPSYAIAQDSIAQSVNATIVEATGDIADPVATTADSNVDTSEKEAAEEEGLRWHWWDLLVTLGALGIFIYGMKVMSEGLQKVAGDGLRKILGGMTNNRLSGVATGFFTTAIIQSSSATTVLVVSFVNAGLLTLIQAMGVIMGANIGTTITAWLVSYLGFKVSISFYAMILIGVSFPFLFAKKQKLRYLAEFILGFGILFIGLEFLKESVPNIKSNPQILEFLQGFSSWGFGSVLIFVAIGTLLTVVVQSSSATMAITLIMLSEGWIDFEVGAAMVLGENIGTTITANLAALVGNVHAKRAARFHSVFNIIGVTWVLILFYPMLHLTDWLYQTIFHDSMSVMTAYSVDSSDALLEGRGDAVRYGLSLFHTSFNVTNTVLLFFAVPFLYKIVLWITPSRGDDEEFGLKYIGTNLMSTPELSLEEARKEVINFGKLTDKMCSNALLMIFDGSKKSIKMIDKIKKREEITDLMQEQITAYLAHTGEQELSERSAAYLRALLRITNELESIGDMFYAMAITKERMVEKKVELPEEVQKELEGYFDHLSQALKFMNANLTKPFGRVDLKQVYAMESEINSIRKQLRKSHYKRIEKGVYSVRDGIMFLEFVNRAERIGDHIVNVNQAMAGQSKDLEDVDEAGESDY